jgi:hypothetical protein
MARHLPVIQAPSDDDAAAAERPAWHWVAITAAFTGIAFLPLSTVGTWLGGRLASSMAERPVLAMALVALPALAALIVSAGSAGAIMGRFGRRALPRSAWLGGASGGALIFFLAALGGALRPWPVAFTAGVVLLGSAAASCRIGFRLGRSPRATPTNRTSSAER